MKPPITSWPEATEADRERFATKYIHYGPTECWPWKTRANSGRYGIFQVYGLNERASRVAWILAYGPIPAGMYVCHHCDYPPCVNPTHLFLGTNRDNQIDAAKKGRCSVQRYPEVFYLRGSRHPNARFVEDDIRRIRTMLAAGMSRTAIAAQFGVSPGTIGNIAQGTRWGWVA